jgi:hypothetical protein
LKADSERRIEETVHEYRAANVVSSGPGLRQLQEEPLEHDDIVIADNALVLNREDEL